VMRGELLIMVWSFWCPALPSPHSEVIEKTTTEVPQPWVFLATP